MALFGEEKSGVLWDSVALPNAFICEYMPSAPEGYVKVYLYGLMYARYPGADEGLTLETLARELGMEESDVTRALQYWERCRLVTRTQDNPPKYSYLSVQQTVMSRQAAPSDDEYMEFAQALYSLFGDRRKLHGGETQLAYEWVEQLGLPREVVLMMVQHLMSTRGTMFSFKEAQKLATELCDQRISTVEAAEQIFSRSEAAWKGTQKILRRMSKFRAPTIDEIDLYVKWTGEWGFAPKAVETACAQMVGGDPSFRYLDAILKGLRERSGRASISAAQLDQQLASEQDEGECVREMLKSAGLSFPAGDAGVREVYRDLRARADHETILLAAQQIGRSKSSRSLDKIGELLAAWRKKGVTTAEDARAYLKQIEAQNRRLTAIYALAGQEKAPGPRDRELLRRWSAEWGFADELIDLAAGYAAGADNPCAFINKLLENWRASGIATREQAEADHRAHGERQAAPGKHKTVTEQKYSQRDYDPAKYDVPSAKELEEALKYDS